MHMIFDVETSGFLVPNYPFEHPKQGRILQVACLLLDELFEEQAFFHSYIDIPEQVEINSGAFDVNGITNDMCKKFGMPIEAAIINLDAFRSKSKYQVAHNISFDLKMIHHEETAIFGKARFTCQNSICTMALMTPICKLPSKRGGFKWPSLEEAYFHVNGKAIENPHHALSDVRATASIFKYLVQEGYIKPANVIELPQVQEELEDSQD